MYIIVIIQYNIYTILVLIVIVFYFLPPILILTVNFSQISLLGLSSLSGRTPPPRSWSCWTPPPCAGLLAPCRYSSSSSSSSSRCLYAGVLFIYTIYSIFYIMHTCSYSIYLLRICVPSCAVCIYSVYCVNISHSHVNRRLLTIRFLLLL